jgi:16S rRNA (adenine1518-N6/adenine1519-N6)-dimethyltransferase
MQTKRQIRQLLESAALRPNRALGQHFLVDLNLMRLLVESANVAGGDVVLEVGCGTGSLTEALAQKAAKVIAVETDRRLADIAAGRPAPNKNVKIVCSDVLAGKHRLNPSVLEAVETARRGSGGRLLLVSNLPYGAAAPVMLNLVEGPLIADAMHVTVQKEVADRMTAAAGCGDYGALSIFLAATGTARRTRVLKPSVFWPKPKVDSAMVSFSRHDRLAGRIRDFAVFARIVRMFMAHRRKTLAACARLAEGPLEEIDDWNGIFDACRVSPAARPQELAAEKYIEMANMI